MANILIMEDELLLASLWKEILDDAGHNAALSKNATEAWDLLGREAFDLLITDIYVKEHGTFVPDGGVILLARVRQMSKGGSDGTSHIPILAISGGASIPGGFDPLRTARDLGADKALRKPISADGLVAAVDELLASKQSAM